MTVIDKPYQIEFASLLALRGALWLELKGMKRRGRSAYATAKERLKINGNKQAVYTQLCEHVEKLKLANYTEEELLSVSEQRLMKPFKDEGWDACNAGDAKSDCPYGMSQALTAAQVPAHVKARRAWMDGYDAAADVPRVHKGN